MPFRYNKKKVALTYAAPVDEQHIWPDKEIAYFAVDYHFSEKGKIIEKYIVAEEEHEDGRLHYHMYLEFNTRLDTTDARYFDIDGMHPNIGDKPGKKQWLDYITKDGNFITNFYQPKISPYKQARAVGGWEAIKILMDKVPRDFDLYEAKHMARYVKAPVAKKEVTWLYGPTGTGKSLTAFKGGAETIRYKNGFYDYMGEKIVVINEIDKLNMPVEEFLLITDTYSVRVNIKGGYYPWLAEKIYFTSTMHPRDVWGCDMGDQVMRRIDVLIETSEEWYNEQFN